MDENAPMEVKEAALERAEAKLFDSWYCRASECEHEYCTPIKDLIEHYKICELRENCEFCDPILVLCCCHVTRCAEQICPMPLCMSIKRFSAVARYFLAITSNLNNILLILCFSLFHFNRTNFFVDMHNIDSLQNRN